MNFEEYKQQIDMWQDNAFALGITLSNGKPLPMTFWKVMLGIKRKVHQDMYNGKHKTITATVSPFIVRTIEVINLLPDPIFIEEVKRCVPLFEADKTS